MNVQSLFVRIAVFAAAAIFLFPCRIAAQQVRAREGVRPDEMADLVAVAMTPSIAFPAPEETVDIAVEVRNQATHAERNVVVALFAGTTRVAEKVINLKSGETTTVHLSWKATLEGTVTLTAQVDPDFKLIERDRHDNLISTDFVVARRPSNEVDLAILGIESVQMPDQSTVLRTRIRNNGKVAAQVPLVIRNDKQIAEVRFVEIAGDATITVEIPWTDSKPPTQLSAEINPRHRSGEGQPADNLLIQDLRPPVDLRVEGLSVSAAQFEATRPRQVTISFRVVNAGANAISRTFRTSVFPGIARSDNAQPFGVHFVTTAGLPIGGAVYISHTIVSPVSEFDVRVEADADNVIAEADESDNIAVSHFKNPTPDVGRWVSIGPRRINGGLGAVGRLSAIAIHPVLSGTLYVGGNLCGVWKTNDNGSTWRPIADALPSLSIAALAIDPSTPTRVYVVTADAGVFRSEDDGTSWTQLPGSPSAEVGSGLLVHPTNRNVLYLRSLSGVQRSRDFGATWQLVLPGAPATDLVMDVMNPDTLYAAREGNGVHKTINGGDRWNQLTNGLLPASSGTIKHITLAICRNSPADLYAGFSTSSGFRLFRTTDAGASWSLQPTPGDPTLFNDVIGVDPINPQFVYITGVLMYRRQFGIPSLFVPVSGPHVDHHEFASDAKTGAIYSLNDGGIYRSFNHGVTWQFIGEGITNVEFYDLAVAFKDPNLVIGGTQDNGTIRFDGTSTVWTEFNGGDGGTVDIDPSNSQILYAMNQGQESIVRFANGNRSCIGCSLPLPPPVCFNLHFQVHPTMPSTLLASCVSLWRANNPQCPQCPNPSAGSSGTPGVWTAILPASVIAPGSIMRSAIDRTSDLYYAGTSIGEVWAGPSGANWQKVFTPSAAGSVTDIEIDLDNPAVIYVSVNGGAGDRIYRLRRLSSTPTSATMVSQPITANLPTGLTVKTLAIDRMTPFTIYAGTNRGVFRGHSLDNGLTWSWTAYNNGMPAADIRDLEVHPVTGVMRAASHGRGAFEVNTDTPIGSLLAAEGKVTLLRVHDVGTGFGPPTDFIDVEVVIALDSQSNKFFGFQLRPDANQNARRDMLKLLRNAFTRERRVRIDYIRTGVRNGRIIRVVQIP